MPKIDPEALAAAREAAKLVQNEMVVGLGSGSTSHLVVNLLADRVRGEGLRFVGIPTSRPTAELSASSGLTLGDLDDHEVLDLAIDGADEVDPDFRMVKGRGGALLREKIVASAAGTRAIVVASRKRVDRLGATSAVPVEVSPFGWTHMARRIRDDLGGQPTLRRDAESRPVATDGGHYILDCRFNTIADPAELDRALRMIPGVFETGLFLGLCDILFVGRGERVEVRSSPAYLARVSRETSADPRDIKASLGSEDDRLS